jgi:hypothetical protein
MPHPLLPGVASELEDLSPLTARGVINRLTVDQGDGLGTDVQRPCQGVADAGDRPPRDAHLQGVDPMYHQDLLGILL